MVMRVSVEHVYVGSIPTYHPYKEDIVYEAIDAKANQTLIKTNDRLELIRYVDQITKDLYTEDIYVIHYWKGVIRVYSYDSFHQSTK